MKKTIALPTVNGKFSGHFGHADHFALVETEDQNVLKVDFLPAPEHQTGSFPAWLHEQGVQLVIASGMGPMAQQRFAQYGIELVLRAEGSDVKKMVEDYLAGNLKKGEDACDHDSPHHQHHH